MKLTSFFEDYRQESWNIDSGYIARSHNDDDEFFDVVICDI